MATVNKLNHKWITKIKRYFLDFLEATDFSIPMKSGKTGNDYPYPEWMIMLIRILVIKSNIKTYVGIHRLVRRVLAVNYSLSRNLILPMKILI